jgi:hypothetical protein
MANIGCAVHFSENQSRMLVDHVGGDAGQVEELKGGRDLLEQQIGSHLHPAASSTRGVQEGTHLVCF